MLLRAGPDVQTHGSVAQHGTPMDLYHRPQNLFVAEFIGSPKMNVLPGRLLHGDADHAVVEVLGVQITAAVDARGAVAGAPVSLGIRPEHLLEGADGAGAQLRAGVRQLERLGNASMLYLDVAPNAPMVTLHLEGHATQATGDAVTLRLRPEQCHLFDAQGLAFRRTLELPA